MIELRGISHSYRLSTGQRREVLRDISATFTEGRSIGILGLNGAGKSTLIRIIAGAETPRRGRVIRRARVSWPVGFGGCFAGTLTGRENLRFVCRIYGANIRRVNEYVEYFTELGDYLNMPYRTYSSGMRSKLAFGLSLAIGFDFYLVDEAFSVGDATFIEKARAELQRLKERATLIFVSHSIQAVQQNCVCGAVLHHGRLTCHDDLQSAIDAYKEICAQPGPLHSLQLPAPGTGRRASAAAGAR